MLLWLVFVVLVLSVAMMLAMFSSFFPFSNQYWNIAQYTSAYYTAMSAVERWALAVKYAGHSSGWIAHWFDGESWWKYIKSTNSYSWVWNFSDVWTWDFFSYGNSWATAMLWTVKSTTNRIPKLWEWDVEPILQESWYHSQDYNMLNYNKTELISLNWSSAISDNKFYEYSSNTNGKITDVSWEFRLNPYLYKKMIDSSCPSSKDCAYLCKNTHCPWEKDQTRSENLPMIDWVLKWRYNSGGLSEFSIIPSESSTVSSTSYHVNISKDSVIRKNNINQYTKAYVFSSPNPVNGTFWDSKVTVAFSWGEQINRYNISARQLDNITGLNVISRNADTLKSMWGFSSVLNDPNVLDPHLSFELINYLWNNQSSKPQLYPFLEYYFSFNNVWMDRYYTIKWEWKVWKYNITLQVKKPTMKDSSLWNFTIIF